MVWWPSSLMHGGSNSSTTSAYNCNLVTSSGAFANYTSEFASLHAVSAAACAAAARRCFTSFTAAAASSMASTSSTMLAKSAEVDGEHMRLCTGKWSTASTGTSVSGLPGAAVVACKGGSWQA